MGQQVAHGTERMGRICHRFDALVPFDEDAFVAYIKDKEITGKRSRRQVVPGGRDHGHVTSDEYATVVFVQVLLCGVCRVPL